MRAPRSGRPARWLALAAGALLAGAAAAAEPPLRVCADPDNPPFTRDAKTARGLYLELAEAVAAKLGRTTEVVWFRNIYGKRAVRSTLLAGSCDLYVGLPAARDFMRPRVIESKPFLEIGYALVTPAGAALDAEQLAGKRVAVQLATPPQGMLAGRDDLTLVTVTSPEEGMQNLADGSVDAAFVWGPVAGDLNATLYANRFRVVPAKGEDMTWPVAIGFRAADAALRDAVNGALDALAPRIKELARQYHFPLPPATSASRPPAFAARSGAGLDPLLRLVVAPAHAQGDAVAEGRRRFNAHCSHCHGPNAQSPEAKTDLRRLKGRYGDKMDEVFIVTVREGRPDKGMPTWKGVIPDSEITAIKAFVESVQK